MNHTHTLINKRKTHKIIFGRIIWSISNNDNPYELQLEQKYHNIHQYISIYVYIFDIVNVDLLYISNFEILLLFVETAASNVK